VTLEDLKSAEQLVKKKQQQAVTSSHRLLILELQMVEI
jgi:hypothetical protein